MTDEAATTCCHATQDKIWIDDAPDGECWQVYAVLADSPTFAAPLSPGDTCCGLPSRASIGDPLLPPS